MNKEKRKEQILGCAKRLFALHGYYNTQISDIIRDAKIARGTFYRYFTNKKDIFVTLLENYYKQWVVEISLESKKLDLKTITPEDYFRHRVRNSLSFFASDPHLCKITLRMGLGLPPDMEHAIQRLEMKMVELIKEDLVLGINNQHIRPDIDIDMTANMIVGAILRISYFYFALSEEQYTPEDIGKMTEEAAHIFLPGIFIKYGAEKIKKA